MVAWWHGDMSSFLHGDNKGCSIKWVPPGGTLMAGGAFCYTIPTIGGADWGDILQHSRRRLNAAAKECAERFGLPHQPMQVTV